MLHSRTGHQVDRKAIELYTIIAKLAMSFLFNLASHSVKNIYGFICVMVSFNHFTSTIEYRNLNSFMDTDSKSNAFSHQFKRKKGKKKHVHVNISICGMLLAESWWFMGWLLADRVSTSRWRCFCWRSGLLKSSAAMIGLNLTYLSAVAALHCLLACSQPQNCVHIVINCCHIHHDKPN